MRKGTTLAAFTAALGLFVLTGCGEESTEDQMNEAAEEAGDAMKEATEGE